MRLEQGEAQPFNIRTVFGDFLSSPGSDKTIPVVQEAPVAGRYVIRLGEYIAPEDIAVFDRRLRRIGQKRGFAFNGSLGDMNFIIDIFSGEKSGIELYEMFTTCVLDYRDGDAYTGYLWRNSIPVLERHSEGYFDEATEEIKEVIRNSVGVKAITEYLEGLIRKIAEVSDMTYREFVLGYDAKNLEPITLIPGIEPLQEK